MALTTHRHQAPRLAINTLNPFCVFMDFALVMITGYHQRMNSVTATASIGSYSSYG
jgi:hypothetical protein